MKRVGLFDIECGFKILFQFLPAEIEQFDFDFRSGGIVFSHQDLVKIFDSPPGGLQFLEFGVMDYLVDLPVQEGIDLGDIAVEPAGDFVFLV